MKIVDKYSRFLEPDEKLKFADQQKINDSISKISYALNASTVNVEIYKCDKCGDYKGVEYI
jgi:hypothetical protein